MKVCEAMGPALALFIKVTTPAQRFQIEVNKTRIWTVICSLMPYEPAQLPFLFLILFCFSESWAASVRSQHSAFSYSSGPHWK